MAGRSTEQQRRARVLVAEDDPAIASLLERALRAEFEVMLAADGPEALAIASKDPPPDLALLDVMLPGIDGFGLAQRFKLLPQIRRLPVIFVTALDTPQDKIKAIQAGGRAYITKPFKLSDVLAKVHSALGR